MLEINIGLINLYKRGIDPDAITNLASGNAIKEVTKALFGVTAETLAFALFIAIVVIIVKVRKKRKEVSWLPFVGMALEVLMLFTFLVPSYVFDSSEINSMKLSPALLWTLSVYYSFIMIVHIAFTSFGIAKWLKSGIIGQKRLVLPRLNSIFHAALLAIPLMAFKKLDSYSLYDIKAYPTPIYISGFFLCASVFIFSIFAETIIKKKLKNKITHKDEATGSLTTEENSLLKISDN